MQDLLHYLLSALAVLPVSLAGGAETQRCERSTTGLAGIYIGYSLPSESALKSFALLHDGRLRSYDGRGLVPGQILHGALRDGEAEVAAVKPYWRRLGDDHCVYAAALVAARPHWEIWISRAKEAARVRRPDANALERFHEHEWECVVQGDRPGAAADECVRPELLAVSDLDGDDHVEYWHTVPYVWDTGLGVSEEGRAGLVRLHEACPGCSD